MITPTWSISNPCTLYTVPACPTPAGSMAQCFASGMPLGLGQGAAVGDHDNLLEDDGVALKPKDVDGVARRGVADLEIDLRAGGLVDGGVEMTLAGVVELHEMGDGDRVDVHMPTTIRPAS